VTGAPPALCPSPQKSFTSRVPPPTPYAPAAPPSTRLPPSKQPSATENGPYDYTRSGDPTREALEKLLAHIEGADRALAFSTGMAATAAATRLVRSGEEILAGMTCMGELTGCWHR